MTLYDTNHKLFILFFRVALYFPYFFPVWLGLVSSFNDEIGITGAILTKLDGDSRGGAALSVKEVSWLTKLLRIFLFYRCIKKLLIHYNTTHLIGPINGRYTITSLDLIFIFYVFTCLWYTQRKRYDDLIYMKGSNHKAYIHQLFLASFLSSVWTTYKFAGVRKPHQICRARRTHWRSWAFLSRSYGIAYPGNGRCTLICWKSTRSGKCPLWNDPFLVFIRLCFWYYMV